ncbi:MFS transporter [Vreelandella arcis]|uniref:MFS transporter n=1 Tax=Vreelandella arcis TaxID=416873 RepID=UPI001B8D4260
MYFRLFNLYFWLFALLGGFLPYCPLYLEGQGFSYLQITTLMATIQVTKIVAPNVWGWLGDWIPSNIHWRMDTTALSKR